MPRQLRQAGAQPLDVVPLQFHRDQIGIGKIPVIVRFFFAAHAVRFATRFVPAARLLNHAAAGFDRFDLPPDFAIDCPLDRTKRVHIFDLGLGAELCGPDRAYRHVGIAAQRAFFHLHVADVELQQRLAQRRKIRNGVLRATNLRFGDALHQRNARTVEVNQRILAAGDATVARAGVRRLAGILFQMDARQAARLHRPVVEPILHLAARRQRHIEL